MRTLAGLILFASLAGCAAVHHHEGLCDPGFPLLVASGAVNTANPPTPTWTVVWTDGRTESWAIEANLRDGPPEGSTVDTRGGLEADLACGVAVFHGSYPGPDWPPEGFPEGPWQMHLEVTRQQVSNADPAPLVSALKESFFTLPEDASLPDCADGRTLAYSAHVDGRSHRSRAYCQGTPEFEAFAASVRAWLDDPR